MVMAIDVFEKWQGKVCGWCVAGDVVKCAVWKVRRGHGSGAGVRARRGTSSLRAALALAYVT